MTKSCHPPRRRSSLSHLPLPLLLPPLPVPPSLPFQLEALPWLPTCVITSWLLCNTPDSRILTPSFSLVPLELKGLKQISRCSTTFWTNDPGCGGRVQITTWFASTAGCPSRSLDPTPLIRTYEPG